MHSESKLDTEQHVDIQAAPEAVFEGLIRRLTADNVQPNGTPMPMVLERRPGGRWFRDLGGDTGHFWATVQSYKPPTLLEFYGPLFMSYPVANNVTFRVTEVDGATRLTMRHQGFGLIDPQHAEGVKSGWGNYLKLIKEDCEKQPAAAARR